MLRSMLADRATEEVIEAWNQVYRGLMTQLLRRQLELSELHSPKSPFEEMEHNELKTEEEK